MRLGIFLSFSLLCVLVPRAAAQSKVDISKLPAASKHTIDFTRDIFPIFQKSCIACHGPEKQRGGLRLDNRDAALEGSDSGPVLVPGKGTQSRLLHVVASLDPEVVMPPKGKTPLTKLEVANLRAWIDQGANWPKGKTAVVKTSSTHWSFQPIQNPPLPAVKHADWVRNPIDRFILARLEKEGWTPSPETDRVTLIRRVSFDLLGLPPTPTEVDDFVRDTRPDAYERLVDRLLASPHYGERWARHWLDLARYADSDGYEADRERPFAWRWRDWVIAALNDDMPFNRFTLEQLAGDLIPGADSSSKIATGFHRNTLTNREGGTDKEQFRVEAVVDRVNTTAQVWLGLTLGCAQCHDHKYDPLSQREYYQFFAFFNSDNEVDLPLPFPGEAAKVAKAKASFNAKKAELQKTLDAYRKSALASWQKDAHEADKKKLAAPLLAIVKTPIDKRTPAQEKQLGDVLLKTDKKLAQLTKAVADHAKKAPAQSIAPTLALGSGRKTHVLLRGDFLRPGVAVQANTPAVLHGFDRVEKANRLQLAQWLVAPENPLTSRVIANWVWQRYFGRGIVPTLEDFGTQGERPTHPELLDYLATEFRTNGWSMKKLHRLIVTSATYRQSSKSRPDLATKDPLNALLARQNRVRLGAEILRDNALAVSGLLSKKIGGPSVKPPQPAGVSELTYANRLKWVESKGEDRHRRGLYTWFQRTSPYPMLMTFDAPDGVLSCVRREKSNTPLQALTLLNDTAFVECSQALARRVLQEKPAGSNSERLEHAFRLCLGRVPDSRESALLGRLLDDLIEDARANPKVATRLLGSFIPKGTPQPEAAAWVALGRALLNLDEFVTRE